MAALLGAVVGAISIGAGMQRRVSGLCRARRGSCAQDIAVLYTLQMYDEPPTLLDVLVPLAYWLLLLGLLTC